MIVNIKLYEKTTGGLTFGLVFEEVSKVHMLLAAGSTRVQVLIEQEDLATCNTQRTM